MESEVLIMHKGMRQTPVLDLQQSMFISLVIKIALNCYQSIAYFTPDREAYCCATTRNAEQRNATLCKAMVCSGKLCSIFCVITSSTVLFESSTIADLILHAFGAS